MEGGGEKVSFRPLRPAEAGDFGPGYVRVRPGRTLR